MFSKRINEHIEKNLTLRYSIVIGILMIITFYAMFIYKEIDKTHKWLADIYQSIVILEDIDSDISDMEAELNFKDTASISNCDSILSQMQTKAENLRKIANSSKVIQFKAADMISAIEVQKKKLINNTLIPGELTLPRKRNEFIKIHVIGPLRYGISDIEKSEKEYLSPGSKSIEFKGVVGLFVISLGGIISIFIIIRALFRLKKSLRKQKEFENFQNVLFSLSEAAHSCGSMEELYGLIHSILNRIKNSNNFFIALYNKQTQILSFPYYVDELDNSPGERKFGSGLTELVIKKEKPVLLNAQDIEALEESGAIQRVGSKAFSWLGVPLINNKTVIGVMVIQSYSANYTFTNDDLTVLNYVSEQVAMSIGRKESEEKNRSYIKQLEEKNKEIKKGVEQLTELNRKLMESEAQLRELNAGKDKYFSILSHDLRSPFNGLLGFTNILKNDFDELSREELKKYIDYISGSTQNLFDLLENVLHWSRMQRGKHEFLPEKLYLAGEVDFILNLLKTNTLNKEIALIKEIPKELTVKADQNMLHSILQNLISNAVKFTKTGGTITVSAGETDSMIRVSVKDTGVGISKDRIQNLFRIDRVHSTKGTNNEPGTGLGLVLIKEMIENHKGKISVLSEEGKGSEFVLLFPKDKTPDLIKIQEHIDDK